MKLPLPRNFKLSKSWIVLGVALGVGLLAALAARSYLSSQMAAIEARAKGKMVNMVVAKQDLSKGAKLSGDNVAVRPIPVDYAHSTAVPPGEFDRIEGQTLAYDVKGGEMIMWSLLEGKKVPTFSARVESGHRAMTVPVDEINSISGMLEPGDMIDLIVTIDHQNKKVTFPLLQSVQVMATGQRSVDDPKGGERRQYATVTLDTTPEQAQSVIVAREAGKITALLRNPQDKQPIGKVRGEVAALLGMNGDLASGDGGVPVLYGGKTEKFPAEALQLGKRAWASNPDGAAIANGGAPSISTPPAAPAIPVINTSNIRQP